MKKLPILILAVALLGFLFGLAHLFQLRFETGDNFPPYSSFRADPVGAKALFESANALVTARRNLQPLDRLEDGADTTLLWLGATPASLRLEQGDLQDLEAFVHSGGRLVIAAMPIAQRPHTNVFAAAAVRKGSAGAPTNLPPSIRRQRRIDIQERWDFAFDYADLVKRDEDRFDPAPAALQDRSNRDGLPGRISLHSALYFDALDPAWRVRYAREQGTNRHAVLIERALGRGNVVLFADSYYFSNEALRDDREPALLSWLLGSSGRILFEETHLGTSETPGVATLARKYRLQPLFVALLVLALLFLWRNASSFMPPHQEHLARERVEVVVGRDSAGAFVNLLRRNIAPAGVLRVCLEQWNAALAGFRKPSRRQLEEMQRLIDAENALEPRHRNPVGTYREFCRILSRSGSSMPDRASRPPPTSSIPNTENLQTE